MNNKTNSSTAEELVWSKTEQESQRSQNSLRLHVMADLHLEFRPFAPWKTDVDVVIIAGDLDIGHNGLDWIEHYFPDKQVIYVLGNHEFYRNKLPELTQTLKQQTNGSHIHLLENEALELYGYTFVGCTLWTSFGQDPEMAMRFAEAQMTDYRIIRNSVENRVMRPEDTAQLHRQSVEWLTSELQRHDPKRTIVVTHHAPTFRSERPQYRNGPLSPSFCSDLDAFIEVSGVPLWIHGHTHHSVDYQLGSTRILSNQRGYPNERCGFLPALVVELDSAQETAATPMRNMLKGPPI